MSSSVLLALSEGEKRVILALFLILILFLVIFGLIGKLTQIIMRHQGEKIDQQVSDAVKLKVINNKKHFISYASKKNWRIFVKQSWIPLSIALFGILVLVIHNAVTNNWQYDVWDCYKTGIGTWFFTWDFAHAEYTEVFFLPFKVLKAWPPLLTTPHWSLEAWASYIFIPCVFVGGIWYLLTLQAVVARRIRIMKLAKKIYSPNLDNFHNDGLENINSNQLPKD